MVKVYTAPNCFKCKILKDKLKETGIEYEESQNYSEVKDLRQLPTLVQEDGTLLSYEYAMLWLGLVEAD